MTLSFDALGVSPELVATLSRLGITEPFPIQALAIADALAGRDVCGKAKTGSGKTLAFGLPLLQRIAGASARAGALAGSPQSEPRRPGGLVLVPTRELARQVADVLAPLAQPLGCRLAVCYGGTGMDAQIKALHKGVDVVVATPGRLIDLLQRGEVSLAAVETVVLDEADRMADMGFLPQVEWVLRHLTMAHQTMLFSATLDGDIDYLVRNHLTDPVRHEVVSDTQMVGELEHRFLLVHQLDKVKVAASVARGAYRTLVFTRTKRGADRLTQQLRREGVKAAAIHGDLRQTAREKALKDFADGKLPVLVATDVAARGIHVDGIDIVVHYDPPEDQKAYLHRSGRTARAGEEGVVVTLVLWDQQRDVERIQKRLGIHQPVVEVFSNDPRLADLRSWDPAAASVA
ncbi:MAG TPA: DEAD/DEAH box helicase [Acidimicrobiales bacterium]|nr:DEAD/DEAH box helicase [Acidimicrobiales bacterium]